MHCVHPGRLHLDLDASQAEPSSFVPDRDDRVVECELANPLAVDREIERTSPRPHLQHLIERARSRERLHPPSDLTNAVQACQARRGQRLSHLEAATQPFRSGRKVLERRLHASGAPSNTQHVTCAAHPPVVCVDIDVDESPRGGRHDPESLNRLGDRRRTGPQRQPALNRP